MQSIWTSDTQERGFPKLMKNISTDTLVIGGGMAGILCARELKYAGVDCVVLEADRIGQGITSGTTAAISAQHSVLYSDLITRFGRDGAKEYLDANLSAVRELSRAAWGVDCDFEMRPSLMYSKTDAAKMRREAEAVQSLGFNASFTEDIPLGIDAAGAVIFPDMAQFHPLKFLRSMSGALTIYERSPVLKLHDMTAHTNSGSVTAKNIVVASHFPFMDRHGLYFMKLHQTRESVVAVENAPDVGLTAVEDSEKGFFFRNYKNFLIVGCGNHIPGKADDDFANIALFLKKYAPEAREVCRWVNQDCVTLDGVPYIGRYSPATPNIFVATGFNAWGMTTSTVSAKLLTALITGQRSDYNGIFSPSRPMSVPPLLKNAGRSAVGLLTPTVPRCTHLGCALRHCSGDHTWECPCHGSRFAEDGSVITGPAVKPANVKGA